MRWGEGGSAAGILIKTVKHRWDDGTKLDLKETWWEGVKWTNLTQDTEK
jgi:hypothetical protein